MPSLRFQLLRRFFRYAFHVAAVLSTLLLIACLILWPRSYYHGDSVFVSTTGHSLGLVSALGRLTVEAQARKLHPGVHVDSWRIDPTRLPPDARWFYLSWDTLDSGAGRVMRTHNYLGLCLHLVSSAYSRLALLSIPFSYLTLLSAILPALWLRRFFRRRRQTRLARPGFPIEPPSPSEPQPSGSVAADSPPPAR